MVRPFSFGFPVQYLLCPSQGLLPLKYSFPCHHEHAQPLPKSPNHRLIISLNRLQHHVGRHDGLLHLLDQLGRGFSYLLGREVKKGGQ